ncbi:MAG TPA: YicC/YloC family endoribonuclease, partial [Steroidobacteraceae bacterium]|nr:YicC/YloC family endoribonuclease [Steroidobacteraceae bacterium]
MTGFARRELASPFGALVCELRSVNHRFLDATLRMPDTCRALEPELRAVLARALKRGKIDCTVTLRGADPGSAELEIDEAALERVLSRLRVLSAAVPEPAHLDLIELLRFPGVLRQDAIDSEALFEAVRELFAATLSELAAARLREGERLSGLIEQRCRLLNDLIKLVRTHLPQA